MADINNIMKRIKEEIALYNNRIQISNCILDDKNIPIDTRGLYCIIQRWITYYENGHISKEFIREKCNVGINKFDRMWDELKKLGVLKQYRIPTKNGFVYKYNLNNHVDGIIKKNKINYNQALTKKIKKKFNYTCQRCGEIEKNKPFHAHHIIPRNTQKYVNDENNLVLLCPSCHKWVHSKLNINKEYIG